MFLLYSYLQVDKNASIETIDKSYKTLAYSYIQSQDTESLQNINTAQQILKDPYKRAFYDKFGDRFISNLSNPSESFFISRLFTTFNIVLMAIFCYLIIANYFFLGLIFAFFPNSYPVLKFSPLICAPLFLIPVLIRSYSLLSYQNVYMPKCIYFSFLLATVSASIFIISTKISILALLAIEIIQLVSIFLISLDIKKNLLYVLCPFIFKSLALTLFYSEWARFKYFIPCISFFGLFILHPLLPIITTICILPESLGIYLIKETSFLKLGISIGIIYSILGFIFILISGSLFLRFFRGIQPNIKLLPFPKQGCSNNEFTSQV